MKRLIWVCNQQYGVHIMKGSYCDHHLFFGSDGKIPYVFFDQTVRGYAYISDGDKNIVLELSEANSRENRYFPEKVVNHFVKNFRGYQITKDIASMR